MIDENDARIWSLLSNAVCTGGGSLYNTRDMARKIAEFTNNRINESLLGQTGECRSVRDYWSKGEKLP